MISNTRLPSTVRGVARSTSVRLAGPLSGVGRTERLLWTVAVSAMVLDLTVTYYGLQLGYTESNPIARFAIESVGYLGLWGLKCLTLGLAACCRSRMPDAKAFLVPAAVAVPWTFAAVVTSTTVAFGPL